MDLTTKVPNEVLGHILSFLPKTLFNGHPQPLYSCALVSKRFNALATPHLYAHVTLTSSSTGFRRSSIDSLTLPQNRGIKFVREITVETTPQGAPADEGYVINPRVLVDMQIQLGFLFLKFADVQVHTDSLAIISSLPQQNVKSVGGSLYRHGTQDLDNAREFGFLSTSLENVTIKDVSATFTNFARAWKFCQSVKKTLKSLRLVGTEILITMHLSDQNMLGKVMQKHMLSPIEGENENQNQAVLSNVESISLEYLVNMDEVIAPFGDMIPVEKLKRVKILNCQRSEGLINSIASQAQRLIDLDIHLEAEGCSRSRELESALLEMAANGCLLQSLKVKVVDCLEGADLGVVYIRKQAFEAHKSKLKRLWVEYIINQPCSVPKAKEGEDEEDEKWLQEALVKFDISGNQLDAYGRKAEDIQLELSLEVLETFPVLEHLALAVEKKGEWDGWAPKVDPYQSQMLSEDWYQHAYSLSIVSGTKIHLRPQRCSIADSRTKWGCQQLSPKMDKLVRIAVCDKPTNTSRSVQGS
ncbi:hypothetical protein ABW20_dc0110044 [Dactylellina cionopaga]|nr:hypothetical protein ABW20_dc0110044 [Dactylellina cionopaga]